MTTYSINWSRLNFLRTVNVLLSVITFMVAVATWILFSFGYAILIFLSLSLVVEIGYYIGFGFSSCRAYWIWFRQGIGPMTEYVARQLGIVREVEIPDNFPQGISRILGLNNASLAEAREVHVGLSD